MPKRKKTESKKSTSNLTPKQREYDKEYKALVNKLKRKAKDINKAATMTLIKISRVLGCKIEDLLEYEFTNK